MNKEWQEFEKLACNVQRDLSPNANVTHNENIRGKCGIINQCDVVIRTKIGTIDFLGVIECKDYESKIGVEVIRGFKSMLKDIGAMKGIIVSAEGFTKDAYRYAEENGIDAYLLVDAKSIKWNKHALVPFVVCEVYLSSCTCVNYCIESREIIELGSEASLQFNETHYRYWDTEKNEYIDLRKLAESVWDLLAGDGKNFKGNKIYYKTNPGRYELCKPNKPGIPVTLELNLVATFDYHFGHVTVDDGQGFLDEKSRKFHSREFVCKPFNWLEAITTWPSTQKREDIPFEPIMWMWAIKFFSPRKNHMSEYLLMGGGMSSRIAHIPDSGIDGQ